MRQRSSSMNFQPIDGRPAEARRRTPRSAPSSSPGGASGAAQDTLPPIFDARSFTIDFAMLVARLDRIGGERSRRQPPHRHLLAGGLLRRRPGRARLLRPLPASFATHFLEDARAIVAATAIVAMCMTFGRVLIFDNPDAAAQAVRAWIFASTYVIAARAGQPSRRDAASASWDDRSADADHRRRRGRPTVRGAARPATRVRPQAGGVPRRRPARGHRGQCDDDPGPRTRSRRRPATGPCSAPASESAIEELRIAHVIVSFSTSSHQAELDLLAPLPGPGRHGVGPAAAVRRGDRPPRARADRRHPDRLGSADGSAGLAIRGQVRLRPGAGRARRSCSPRRS